MTHQLKPVSTAYLQDDDSTLTLPPESPGRAPSTAWRADRSFLIDQAYDEYCQKLESGAALDPDAFCERFPQFQTSLRRLLAAHHFLEENTQLIERPPARWPQPGERFLGFVLERELGRGAFGRVFLARDTALGGRRVAVKVAPGGEVEANMLGRLDHPNVVPVYSAPQDPETGLTAVCMPYLGAATLCDVLDLVVGSRGLPARATVFSEAIRAAAPAGDLLTEPPAMTGTYVGAVASLGAQLAEALATVHARGICHRDLKPSNVLLAPDGRPMLLDFNLSADQQVSPRALGGTLPYMAPEHIQATEPGCPSPSRVNAQSDVFSLGVLLYELLAGVHPFGPVPVKMGQEEARVLLLGRQRTGPRPLKEFNPAVNGRLARAVERCLVWESDRRPTAQELAHTLRQSQSPASRLVHWIGRRILLVSVLALSLTAGGAAGGSYLLFVRPSLQTRMFQEGADLYRAGQFALAIKSFDKAIEADPKNGDFWLARAKARQRLGDADWLQAALTDFREAERLLDNGDGLIGQADCLTCSDQHAKAFAIYKEASAKGQRSARVLNNLAAYYIRQGGKADLADADKLLREAANLDSEMQEVGVNQLLLQNKLNKNRNLPRPPFGGSLQVQFVDPLEGRLF